MAETRSADYQKPGFSKFHDKLQATSGTLFFNEHSSLLSKWQRKIHVYGSGNLKKMFPWEMELYKPM